MRDKYKETFDKIPFSTDFEQRVIEQLALKTKVPKQKVFIKRKALLLLPVCGMIIICIVGMFSMWNSYFQGIENNILSKEEMQKIVGIETIEIVQSEKGDHLFDVQDKSLDSGEMLILDCGMKVSKGDTVCLQAEVKEADMGYDIGYILDGDFTYLQKNITSESFVHNVAAEKSGSFYWCISNRSENVISFSATVQYGLNDLVYRNYGSDVISVNETCMIRLENIQSLLPLKEIKGIYLYNYEQKMTKEFPADTESIEYKVEQGGTYSIYALTEDGETVSLNRYVSVEYDSTNFYIDENNEESIIDGIINL